ncbi:glycoside hydrolase family 16 protein [Nocardioides sp. SYSU DS0651]|uniref:glycoside hydrolase family 16 protein n=1 Tax=Nocardioides sp. SYSU DS0651 TaxID=3415955 RepID=UPI003F4BC4C4
MIRRVLAVLGVLCCVVTAAAIGTPGPSTATPVAPARALGDPCGARLVKPTGGYWICTMADYFSGSTMNPDLWVGVDKPGTSGDLCVISDARTVVQRFGKLRLSVRRAGSGLECPLRADGTRGSYVGSWVSSHYRWSQQYGRIEARIKVRAASRPGLHEAFWLWPDVRYTSDSPWPSSGEIDVVETFSAYPDLAIPHLHYGPDDNGGPVPGLNTAWDCRAPRGQWHTYVLEWTPHRLTIRVDGRTCLVNTHGASSFRKPFILNFTQLLGGGHNRFDGQVSLPATMEVDHVRAWR